MSDITTVILLMAVGLGHVLIAMALDKRMLNEAETIVTGATPRGVPVPSSHRRMVFSRYLAFYGNIIAVNLATGVGYFVVGHYADFEALRWLAYMYAVLSVAAALGYVLPAPIWYRHVSSVLPQAEAD